MANIIRFIESVENQNTAKVVKHVLKNTPSDIEQYSLSELNSYILNMKPRSEKQITTIRYILGLYAKWLIDQNLPNGGILYEQIQKIDKKQLWKEAKPNAEKKFISNVQYRSILHEISVYEEYNPLYFEVLFSSIYEGLYSDDLSVLKNLRSSDIEDTLVTLREDSGNSYKIHVSKTLSDKLKELSAIDIWKRPNRYGICNVPMIGCYSDSVFKVEQRNTQSDRSWKFTYYSKLRKIKDEYIGYNVLPLQLYISGIIHRIQYLLEKKNISLEEAFADNCRNQLSHQIITKELQRCNSIIEIGNFREIIKGHIDFFGADSTEDVSGDVFDEIIDEVQDDAAFTEFLEGEEVLATHLSHERNKEVVNIAKELFKASHSGRLFCEACGFDFKEKYGTRGVDFIEAHHINPMAARSKNEVTKVEDIALLCSNCHSIVHRRQPWLSITQLKNILEP